MAPSRRMKLAMAPPPVVTYTRKVFSIGLFMCVSIGMEELNQFMYANGYGYPSFFVALQWIFILFTLPLISLFANKVSFLKSFKIERIQWSRYLRVWDTGLIFPINACIARYLAKDGGSGSLDVNKALVLPLSALVSYAYDGNKQSTPCMIGIGISTLSFFVNFYYGGNPDLSWYEYVLQGNGTVSWNIVINALIVAISASHMVYMNRRKLKYFEYNSMKMMWYHTPWYIVGCLFLALTKGEFGMNRFVYFGMSTKDLSYTDSTGELVTVTCSSIQETFMNDPRMSKYGLIFLNMVMGLFLQIASSLLLASVSVVTNMITSQIKATLISVVGLTREISFSGYIASRDSPKIISTIVKTSGSVVYTGGKIAGHFKKSKDDKNELPITSSDDEDLAPNSVAIDIPSEDYGKYGTGAPAQSTPYNIDTSGINTANVATQRSSVLEPQTAAPSTEYSLGGPLALGTGVGVPSDGTTGIQISYAEIPSVSSSSSLDYSDYSEDDTQEPHPVKTNFFADGTSTRRYSYSDIIQGNSTTNSSDTSQKPVSNALPGTHGKEHPKSIIKNVNTFSEETDQAKK